MAVGVALSGGTTTAPAPGNAGGETGDQDAAALEQEAPTVSTDRTSLGAAYDSGWITGKDGFLDLSSGDFEDDDDNIAAACGSLTRLAEALGRDHCATETLEIMFSSGHRHLRLAFHEVLRSLAQNRSLRSLRIVYFSYQNRAAEDDGEEVGSGDEDHSGPNADAEGASECNSAGAAERECQEPLELPDPLQALPPGAVESAVHANQVLEDAWDDASSLWEVSWLAILCHSLAGTTTLKTLQLEGCMFSDVGAALLGDMLKHNRTLKQVLVGGAYFVQDAGIAALAQGISQNSMVEDLDLWDNRHITERGMLALVRALRLHPSVKRLHLTLTGYITTAVAEALVELVAAGAGSVVRLEKIWMDEDYAIDEDRSPGVRALLEPLVEAGVIEWEYPDWD